MKNKCFNISEAYLKSVLTSGDQPNSKTLSQIELERVLNSDIHDTGLGCKINNTHVEIGDVHLGTFYEAQLLFGNAYWTEIFAFYYYSKIKSIFGLNYEGENRPIILYGYETYSALTINKTAEFLKNDKKSSYIRIFEVKKGDYREERVRYIDDSDSEKIDESLFAKKPIIFFLVGISSTLSTFQKMNNRYLQSISNKDYYEKAEKYCLTIAQVIGQDGDDSHKYIALGEKEGAGSYSKCAKNVAHNYLSFATRQEVYYYVSVESDWHQSTNCPLCINRKNYLEEFPLIMVDESSVVPTQMIHLNNTEEKQINDPIEESKMITESFLKNVENKKYLYYDHILNDNNHYQYFFRLARLFADQKEQIEEKWLREIIVNKYKESLVSNSKTINVIVSPQHYSSSGFVHSVNKMVFNNEAHIIEFDIRKEFRSNFKAKNSNYMALRSILEELDGFNVDFFYVTDQIVSNEMFYRAQSLIKSLCGYEYNNRIHIFKGIFVLLNRNSRETRQSFVNLIKMKNGNDELLPYFSYINLDIPSLRCFDDSCPICFENKRMLNLADNSSLDKTKLYWQKKIIDHSVKDLNTLKRIKSFNENRFNKLYYENELWNKIKHQNNENNNPDKIIEIVYNCIKESWQRIDDKISGEERNNQKIEVIISYIKILSKPLLFYQENVKKASLSILLCMFNFLFVEGKLINNVYCNTESVPIGTNKLDIDISMVGSEKLRYDLAKMVVSYICSNNSCALLNAARLEKCREIGKFFYESVREEPRSSITFDDFLLYSLKKLVFYDIHKCKSILLDKLILEDLIENKSNNDRFAEELFFENNRDSSNELANKMEVIIASEKTRYERYEELINEIKRRCEATDIQLFAKHNTTIFSVSSGSIPVPKDFSDYEKDDSDSNNDYYYLSFSNNYQKLINNYHKNPIYLKLIQTNLGIIDDISIIVGIKTGKNKINIAKKVLELRNQIMSTIHDDFNSNIMYELETESRMVDSFILGKAVSHSEKPLLPFSEIFKQLNKSSDDNGLHKELLLKFLDIYMSNVISFAYNERLVYVETRLRNSSTSNSMFHIGYNKINDSLDFALKHLCDEYNNENNESVVFWYRDSEKTDICNKNGKKIKSYEEICEICSDLDDNWISIRTRNIDEICQPYMIIREFIKNAINHSRCKQVDVIFEKNKNSIYLIVKNKCQEERKSKNHLGITNSAFDYLFNKLPNIESNNKTDDNEIKLFFPNSEEYREEGIYTVVLKDFLIKQ